MKLSEKTRMALLILNEVDLISANRFAEKMWPDSPCWVRVKNTGNGACSGKGMWLAAGSYLSKLKNRGLVYQSFTKSGQSIYGISPRGKMLLTLEVRCYQIDFGNHLRCKIKVTDNEIEVEGAINGWGDGVPLSEVVVVEVQ